MSNLHPVMAAALAPFVKPWPGNFDYTMNGVDLDCRIDYEAAERGSRESGTGLQLEPDYPATVYLVTAFVGDVDIYELLSDTQRAEIETAFLLQEEDV